MSVPKYLRQHRAVSSNLREEHIQQAILDLLALLEIPHSVTDASRVFGPDGRPRKSKVSKGWFDITGCMPDGRFLGIEVKTKTGSQSPEQRAVAAKIAAFGGLAVVVRSAQEMFEILKREKVPAIERVHWQ